MKKIAIATLLAVAAASSMAVEVGLTTGHTYSDTDRTSYGLTVSQSFGKYDVTAGVDRSFRGSNDLTQYSLVSGFNVANIGSVPVSAKAGLAYVNPQIGQSGYAALIGVGTSFPLNKSLALTVDYRYQLGQSRVNNYDGSNVMVGLKYAL